MGKEIDLMANYPKAKRNLEQRAAEKTDEERSIARQFGKDFFDGDRCYGYGGYSYHFRFWGPVVPTFKEFYNLTGESRVLDVGCGKGFMLHDLVEAVPGISVAGIDISDYAIENCYETMEPYLRVADVRQLPFSDNFFDLSILNNF